MIFVSHVLFRAKHRKDARYEETRGDWYFQRKHYQKDDEYEYPSQLKDKKTKGEDYKENKKSKGETEKENKRHKRHVNAREIYNERNNNHGKR